MTTERPSTAAEKEDFHSFYLEMEPKVRRYAKSVLSRNSPSRISYLDRVDDVVQETFAIAWKKWEEVKASPSPEGWIIRATCHKTQENLRDDLRWDKGVLLTPEFFGNPEPPQALPEEWDELKKRKEFRNFFLFYEKGYTYAELCKAFNLKKSTLGMDLKRAREKLRKIFKNM